MRMLAVAVITVLTVYAANAQQLAPRNTEPVTINLVNTAFDDAIGFVARHAGIDVQFDDTATRERRTTPLTLSMKNVALEEALDAMTRRAGLTYKVVDAKTIRIYELP